MEEGFVDAVGQGVLLRIYTQPRSSRTAIVGIHDGMLKIACNSPPVDGKANKELIDFLAHLTGVAKREVELVRGHTSRRKQFLIHGIELQQLLDIVAEKI